MDRIQIKSKFFDYTVEFVDSADGILPAAHGECVYVLDSNVYTLYKTYFEHAGTERVFLVDAVESEKNIYTVIDLVDFLRKAGFKKSWKLIAVGGGITQDICSFTSAVYLRNIDWVFFPTTLLSMSDSCIGGKCGINHGEYKNQLGVFYPPKRVYIYEAFLNTLSADDWINGWGEILKMSLIDGPDFYNELTSLGCYIPCAEIGKYIHWSLLAKKRIIEEDEFEGGLRRILNYGHTFGHALESYTNNKIPHGKAVIWGMDVENYIAVAEGLIDRQIYLAIKSLIKEHFLTSEIQIGEPSALFPIIGTDKKVLGSCVHLALPTNPGKLIVYPMEIGRRLEALFEEYLIETHEYYGG